MKIAIPFTAIIQARDNSNIVMVSCVWNFPGDSVVKNPTANAGDERDAGSIPGQGRSPGEGNGNPLQYSCLENLTDRGAYQATVHRVAKSRTRLSITHAQLGLSG